MDFPCPIAIHCGDYPFANLSSEGNETCLDCPPTFGAYFTSVGYCCDTTMKVGYSQISQSDADLVLERILATACPNCDPPQKFCADARCPDGLLLTTTCVPTSQADADALAAAAANAMLPACDDPSQLFQATCSCPDGSNPTTIYSNVSEEVAQAQCEVIPKVCTTPCSTEQCCGFTHSDGTTIFCCLPAGAICAPTQAQANAAAYSLICGRVQTSTAHLSSLPLFWCLSTLFHEVVTLTGVTGNATQWFLIPHGPPSGLVLTKLTDNTALLEMTPATPGNFIFTIRAVISPTCYVERLYTLVVFGFTAITPDLPNGTVGVDYSEQIIADGGSGNYLFEITDGALPDGLQLGPTGFVTGIPTTEETGIFTVTVTDLVTPAMQCSMQFELDVGTADFYYWTLDEVGYGNRVDSVDGLVLPAGAHIGGGSISLTSAAGKFSNATRFENIFPVPGDLQQSVGTYLGPYLPELAHSGTGFSLAFWIKINSFGTSVGFVDYFSNPQHGEILLQFTNAGAFVRCIDDGGVHLEDLPVALVAGTWYFFHLFHDATLNKMGYSINDGAETYASFVPVITASAGGMVTLFQNGAGTPNDYLTDELIMRVDARLSAAQVTYLYNSGTGRTWPISLP